MTHRPVELLLLDFDGVLVDYDRRQRVLSLSRQLDCTPAQVQAALFDSGLEQRYDAGDVDTPDYLDTLGSDLGTQVTGAHWLQARAAASRPRTAVITRIAQIAAQLPIAILTNNGPLLARLVPTLLPELFPALDGRVLCSGALGGRKPDPAVFLKALQQVGATPATTLFIDDLFLNVRGARRAGLQADTARDTRSLGRVLRRHGL